MSSALATGVVLVVALLAVLVVGLLRSHAEVLRALHDMGVDLDPASAGASSTSFVAPGASGGDAPVGSELDVVGATPTGEVRRLAVAGTRHTTLLAFLSSSCLTCRGFWREFADPELGLPAGARLVIVTQGEDAESPSAVAELAPPHVVTMLSSTAWADYRVPGAPYFALVDGTTSRVIGEGSAPTWPKVAELLRRAAADNQQPADREAEVDAVLGAAGIGPDDPSLRPGRRTPAGPL